MKFIFAELNCNAISYGFVKTANKLLEFIILETNKIK